MKKLTLSQWTSIAEILGMFAVVISLIFVGMEIRQNTNQVKAASLETGVDYVKAVFELTDTVEKASFIRRGLADFDSLTVDEKMVFDSMLSVVTIEFENVIKLYQQGHIDEGFYNNYELIQASIYLTPGGREWFERTQAFYPDDSAVVVRNMIEKYEGSITLSEYFNYLPVGK